MVLAILDVKSIQINVHFVRDKLVVLPVMLNFRIVKKKITNNNKCHAVDISCKFGYIWCVISYKILKYVKD